jgi:tryptophan synthase beta chain
VAKKFSKSDSIVITLSGRGDKDVEVVENYLNQNVKNKK